MNADLIADWIIEAPGEIRAVFAATLQPSPSNFQMAGRIARLAANGHCKSCPWRVGIYPVNPKRADWSDVPRFVARQKGITEPTRGSEVSNQTVVAMTILFLQWVEGPAAMGTAGFKMLEKGIGPFARHLDRRLAINACAAA